MVMGAVRLVAGVGVNDADYKVTSYEGRCQSMCPFYKVWSGMIKRCYSKVHQAQRPTYIGCSVCSEWLTFSNFKAWMEKQDWHGKHLDKDLLTPGNRVYAPEFCVFVDAMTNSFTIDSGASRGDCPLGVSFHKASGRYAAYCNNPFSARKVHLGLYDDMDAAHFAWKKKKHELSCVLSEMQSDQRVADALKGRYL